MKKGDEGKDVKELQRLLGLTTDGKFGTNTDAAVRLFQRGAGLTVDGIAGQKTMDKLRSVAVPIIDGHIQSHISRSPSRPVKYIAIHYTAGSNSRKGSAMTTRKVFLTRQASADFVVDDEQIVQINPDVRNYYCWAVGDKHNGSTGGGSLYGRAMNKNTVSIEICSTLRIGTTYSVPNHDGWSFTDKVLENARRLVRYLMCVYDVPLSNVVRHYDVSGKLCPGIPGWNDGPLYTTDGKATYKKNNSKRWIDFKTKI